MDGAPRRSGLQDRSPAADLHRADHEPLHPALPALSGPPQALAWIDGRVVARREAAIPIDDSAYLSGLGCYTTARQLAGRILFAARHGDRLSRHAARLGLDPVASDRVVRILGELGRASFGEGDGIVKVQASRDAHGRTRLVGLPRSVGPGSPAWNGETWDAISAALPHPGPTPVAGCKLSSRIELDLAQEEARRRGAVEALLFDRQGRLVEGSRSQLVVVGPAGDLRTPPPSRGGVESLSQSVLLERIPELRVRDLSRRDLADATAVFATNAARGLISIARLDGRRLDRRAADETRARLAAALLDDAADPPC